MVQLQVLARVRAEWRYRLLSCPESAAAVEQLGAALAVEQLVQPAAEGAARQPTAAAEEGSSSSAAVIAAGQTTAAATKGHI